jgi:hypothetical protein
MSEAEDHAPFVFGKDLDGAENVDEENDDRDGNEGWHGRASRRFLSGACLKRIVSQSIEQIEVFARQELLSR